MRSNRLVGFVVAAALLGLPALVVSASSASARQSDWATNIEPSAGPNPQLYKRRITFTATLTKTDPSTETDSPVVGQPLQLQAKRGSSFETVAQVETDDSGFVELRREARRNTKYRFRYAGGNDGSNELAPSKTTASTFYVAKDLNATTSRTGNKIYYKVDVAPAGRQKVVLQRKKCAADKNCDWKNFDAKRTSKGGEAKFLTKNPPVNKTWTYRGMTKETKNFIQSYGQGLKISTSPARGLQGRLVSR